VPKVTQSSSSPTHRRRKEKPLLFWDPDHLKYLALDGRHNLSPSEILLPLPGRNNPMGVVVDLENNRWEC